MEASDGTIDVNAVLSYNSFKAAKDKVKSTIESYLQKQRISRQASKLFSRCNISNIEGMDNFRKGLIDLYILDGLDSRQQGLIFYLSTRSYTLDNGIILPFTATIHESNTASPFIMDYIVRTNPGYAQRLIKYRLDDSLKSQQNLMTDSKLLEEEIDDYLEYSDDKSRSKAKKEILAEAAEKVAIFQTLASDPTSYPDDPAAYPGIVDMVISYLFVGHSFSRNKQQVEHISSYEWVKKFGGDERKITDVFAISDNYRLHDEQKLATLEKLQH